MKRFGMVMGVLAWAVGAGAEEAATTVTVAKLPQPPVVDGDLAEWGGDGWLAIAVKPAMEKDDKNTTGELTVQLKLGVAGDRLFIAARYPDAKADTIYRTWEWKGSKYKRGKERDDMFAVRFHLDGDFYKCMLSKQTYRVDLWQWSAGRSNQAGLAEDYFHQISAKPLENAAEHEIPGGGIAYIRKVRDEGTPFYENTQPDEKTFAGDSLPGIEMKGAGDGSLVDVTAKGVWADGHWNLEFSRKLDTGHADDAAFQAASKVLSQIAVFNEGYAEHKSISEPLLLDFSGAM